MNDYAYVVFSLGLDDFDFDQTLVNTKHNLSFTDSAILLPCMVETTNMLIAEMGRYQGFELMFAYTYSDNIFLVAKNEDTVTFNTGWCLTTMIGYATKVINRLLQAQFDSIYCVYGREPDALYNVYQKALNYGTYFTGRYDFMDADRVCISMQTEHEEAGALYRCYFKDDSKTFSLVDDNQYAQYGYYFSSNPRFKYFDVTRNSFDEKKFRDRMEDEQ